LVSTIGHESASVALISADQSRAGANAPVSTNDIFSFFQTAAHRQIAGSRIFRHGEIRKTAMHAAVSGRNAPFRQAAVKTRR
jgi:hypothetical protein